MKGETFEIPSGEGCYPIDTEEHLKSMKRNNGDFREEQRLVRLNQERGYCLVMLRGMGRWIKREDFARREDTP